MLATNKHFDVIIAGLGVMGSSALYHLSLAGMNVCGIDRYKPPHSHGSSHGESRIIRQAYFESPFYVPLVQQAYSTWKDIEQASGKKLLLENGSLMLGERNSTVIKGTLDSAHQYGLPVQFLEHDDLKKRFPAFRIKENTVAVLEQTAGILYPENCVAALLELATVKGAFTLFNETIKEIAAESQKVRVTTNRNQYTCSQIIVSTGAWTKSLLPGPALPLQAERRVVHWFKDRNRPSLFEPAQLPVYIWEFEKNKMLYGFPDLGNGIKIASTKKGIYCEPEELDKTVKKHEIEEVRYLLEKHFHIRPYHSQSTVCMYTMTPDEHFIIDKHPVSDRIIVASPCSGHGFKFASVIGKILADMATGTALNFDPTFFKLNRFMRPAKT